MDGLAACFADLADPRTGNAGRHDLLDRHTDAPVACPDWACHNRNMVVRLWGRLKEWRAGATRYEKTARSFPGVLSLAATADRLKP